MVDPMQPGNQEVFLKQSPRHLVLGAYVPQTSNGFCMEPQDTCYGASSEPETDSWVEFLRPLVTAAPQRPVFQSL